MNNDHIDTLPAMQALYAEHAQLLVERRGLQKLLRDATEEADVEQLAVILPGVSTVQLNVLDVEWRIQATRNTLIREEREKAEKLKRLTEHARLPLAAAKVAISDYSGTPFVVKHDGQCFLAIYFEGASVCVKVSKAFYDAFTAEFENKAFAGSGKHMKIREDETDEYPETYALQVVQ